MIKTVHPLAGALAILTIASFWLATIYSELFGSEALIVTVKMAIPWGFLILVPALTAAGGTGFRLARGHRAGLVGAKAKRMPIVALNGVVVLIPAAFYLAYKADLGAFDASFYMVQSLELAAGAVNLTLLGLNMRDGLKLTGRRR